MCDGPAARLHRRTVTGVLPPRWCRVCWSSPRLARCRSRGLGFTMVGVLPAPILSNLIGLLAGVCCAELGWTSQMSLLT